MERFIILSVPRSGSTVLTRTLDHHPEIFCAGEIFNTSDDIYHPEFHFKSWGFKSTNHSVQALNRIINYPNHRFRAVPHIKHFFSLNNKNEKARGFKLMYSNINTAPYLWNFIKRENIKTVLLLRKNLFKTLLSRYRKATNRIAHAREGQSLDAHFGIPGEKMLKQMKHLENINTNLISLSKETNSLIIFYEEFEDWNATIRKAEKFIGVSQLVLPAVLKKIAPVKWQDEVENYNEIEQLLIQNNYQEYI